MDAGNIDGDGNRIIVLVIVPLTLERSTFNWKKGPPFMIYNH